MANHKSALKRAKQNELRRMRNKAVKTRVKTIVKLVQRNVQEGSKENALKTLDAAKSIIDKAAKKGVLHKKAASRKISRLTKQTNQLSA